MTDNLHASSEADLSTSIGSFVGLRIAVLIPCYNEVLTIGTVVADFRRSLPSAIIYVYDNNSNDETCRFAAGAGAVIRHEPFQGKGAVVKRMFSDVEADIYVLVDGDNTYDASVAPQLINELITSQLDCVNGARVASDENAYRSGHRLGNWLFTTFVSQIFGRNISDVLTGYRVLSRRFVKTFPALSSGFDIEAEMTIHALELCILMKDVPTIYRPRPNGSVSKLNSYRDGLRILRTIGLLIKEERPFQFFSIVAALLASLALAIFLPVFFEYLDTGLVRRFPTAILSAALMLAGSLSFVCGLILETVTRGRREMKRLHFLQHTAPSYIALGKQPIGDAKKRGLRMLARQAHF